MERRKFITGSLAAAAGLTSILAIPALAGAEEKHITKEYTVQDIIDLLIKEVPGAPFNQTVDTLKSGSGDQKVTGIVSTMFATVEVINQAAKLGANFIIAHEPTFYNHADNVNWVANNKVVMQKQELLQKHKIAVWRFHDYWHSYKPDGVSYGVMKAAGWLSYYQPDKRTITIPAVPLRDIVQKLKSALGIEQVRVIGDLSKSCQRLVVMPGAAGGDQQVSNAEKEQPDVLIVGELREWETAEYIRDARLLGSNISLIVLGHSVSEEPGMQWLVEYLSPKLPELKITHVASKSPFLFV